MAETTQKTAMPSRKLRGTTRAHKSRSEGANSALAAGDLEKTQRVGVGEKPARMVKCPGVILSTGSS